MELVITAFLWLLIAIVTAVVAGRKGRSEAGWFFLGLIFSLIGLLVVACLPVVRRGEHSADVITQATHTRCPDCAEVIRREAKVCRHCRKQLVPA